MKVQYIADTVIFPRVSVVVASPQRLLTENKTKTGTCFSVFFFCFVCFLYGSSVECIV